MHPAKNTAFFFAALSKWAFFFRQLKNCLQFFTSTTRLVECHWRVKMTKVIPKSPERVLIQINSGWKRSWGVQPRGHSCYSKWAWMTIESLTRMPKIPPLTQAVGKGPVWLLARANSHATDGHNPTLRGMSTCCVDPGAIFSSEGGTAFGGIAMGFPYYPVYHRFHPGLHPCLPPFGMVGIPNDWACTAE